MVQNESFSLSTLYKMPIDGLEERSVRVASSWASRNEKLQRSKEHPPPQFWAASPCVPVLSILGRSEMKFRAGGVFMATAYQTNVRNGCLKSTLTWFSAGTVSEL